MFPIRDHNPSGSMPVITYTLIAMNIGVFFLHWPLITPIDRLEEFYNAWALFPARVSSGNQVYTLVTSMFMHGSLAHIAGNMLFLWIFGDNMEDALGKARFMLFYLACGVLAALAQVITAPFSQIPMVGASGAIAGVLGGYLLLYPKARVDVLFIFVIFFKIFTIPAWLILGLWFAMQVFGGIGSVANMGGVAYWAHAGGFVAGAALAYPLWKRLGGQGFWHRHEGHPPHAAANYRWHATRVPVISRRKRKNPWGN